MKADSAEKVYKPKFQFNINPSGVSQNYPLRRVRIISLVGLEWEIEEVKSAALSQSDH